MSTRWRSRIWSRDLQDMNWLSHSVSLNLKDNNYWTLIRASSTWENTIVQRIGDEGPSSSRKQWPSLFLFLFLFLTDKKFMANPSPHELEMKDHLIKKAMQEVVEKLKNEKDAAIKRKILKNNEDWKNFLRSIIRNPEQWVSWGIKYEDDKDDGNIIKDSKSFMILTHRADLTYLRSSSSSYFLEFMKA